MSQALWMRATADTSVGSATITAATDVLTIASHELEDGQRVVVSNLAGGAVGAVADGGVYYVRDVAGDDFRLALTLHGLAIEFDTDGSADVDRFDPGYDPRELRRADGVLMMNDTADRFGARSGIHPSCAPAVSLSGTTWTVEHIKGTIYPGQTPLSGPYRFQHPTESGSLNPADGAQDRYDQLFLVLRDDDEDESGERHTVVVYEPGDPGAGVPPAEPDGELGGFLPLHPGGILVHAGGTPDPELVDPPARRTVAAGGIVPVFDDNDGPDSPHISQFRWNEDTGRLEVWTGLAWTPIAAVGGWETVVNTTISGTTNIPIPSGVYDMVRVHLRGRLDAEARVTMRINDDGTSNLHRAAWAAYRLDTGAVADSNANDTTVWSIAQWSTGSNNTAEATIFNTDVSTNLSFQGSGFRAASSTALRERTLSGGDLASPRLLSSLRFSASGSDNIDTCEVVIEGHRA